jgi:hypothetical protein
LARRLVQNSRKGVLHATAADLILASHLKPGELLAQCAFTREAGLWMLSAPESHPRGYSSTLPADSDLASAISVLSARFDFVLLDCGAVNGAGQIWQVGPVVDDVFLVVAAGQTTRDQIAFAQRIIAQSGSHLSGCILNKRTYPIPPSIHRMLK